MPKYDPNEIATSKFLNSQTTPAEFHQCNSMAKSAETGKTYVGTFVSGNRTHLIQTTLSGCGKFIDYIRHERSALNATNQKLLEVSAESRDVSISYKYDRIAFVTEARSHDRNEGASGGMQRNSLSKF